MKALSIISLVIGPIAAFIVIGFIIDVSQRRSWSYDYLDNYEYSYQSGGSPEEYNSYYDDYNRSFERTEEATQIGAMFTAVGILYFIVYFITALLKLRTKTMKVLSIIGLSLGGIMLLWSLLVMANPGGMSFDEVGPVFFFYMLVAIGFAIAGTVHSFRKRPATPVS